MRLTLSLLLAFLLLQVHLMANDPNEIIPKNKVTMLKDLGSPLINTLHVESHDATLEELCIELKRALGNTFDVIFDSNSKGIRIPPVTLQNTNVLMILDLINDLFNDLEMRISLKGEMMDVDSCLFEYFSILDEDGGFDAVDKTDCLFFNQADITPVILISLIKMKNREFRIIPIDEILNSSGADIDDVSNIATAIETAWEMMNDSYTASLKYHKETNLLICSGSSQHLDCVDRVIGMISGEYNSASLMAAQKMEAKISMLEKEVAELKTLINSQKKLIRELTDKLKGPATPSGAKKG